MNPLQLDVKRTNESHGQLDVKRTNESHGQTVLQYLALFQNGLYILLFALVLVEFLEQ